MSIKDKNKILVGGFVGVLLIGYFFSITDTLSLKENYKRLKSEEHIFENLPQRVATLNKKENYYDSLMVHYQIAEASLQNSLLKSVENYALDNELKIVTIEQPHILVKDQRKISSYAFAVSGNFRNILGLNYHLEQKSKFGKVSNVHFEKKINHKTKRATLEGRFILQLIQ